MHLSVPANRDEFQIPWGRLGDLVCTFELMWVVSNKDNHVQPAIKHPLIAYPGYRNALPHEINFYTPYPFESDKNHNK